MGPVPPTDQADLVYHHLGPESIISFSGGERFHHDGH